MLGLQRIQQAAGIEQTVFPAFSEAGVRPDHNPESIRPFRGSKQTAGLPRNIAQGILAPIQGGNNSATIP